MRSIAGLNRVVLACSVVLLAATPCRACWWCWHGYHRHRAAATVSTTVQPADADAPDPFGGGARPEKVRTPSDAAAPTAAAQPELSAVMLAVEALRNPELRDLARRVIAKAVNTGTEPSLLRELLQPIVDRDAMQAVAPPPASALESRIAALEAKTEALERRLESSPAHGATAAQELFEHSKALQDAVEKLGEAAQSLEATARNLRRAKEN